MSQMIAVMEMMVMVMEMVMEMVLMMAMELVVVVVMEMVKDGTTKWFTLNPWPRASPSSS